MAKHYRKNRKGPVHLKKYRHLKESKWDFILNKTIDFLSGLWEKICLFFSEAYEKISEIASEKFSVFSQKDTYQSKHGENDNPKIIELNAPQFKHVKSEPEKKPLKPARFSQERELKHFKEFDIKELKDVILRKKKTSFSGNLPTSQQLEAELKREVSKRDNSNLVRNTVFSLVTIAAVVVLIAIFLLPVFQIYGTSMQPTFQEGDIVVSVKGSDLEQKDLISFYYNNKILVKRVIAFEGDFVNIDEDGNVYVNKKMLDEPYLDDKALGEYDIEFPYQVPAGKVFVLGDYRATSVDSRNKVMGCVSEEQIIGEIIFRVWPINRFGTIDQ